MARYSYSGRWSPSVRRAVEAAKRAKRWSAEAMIDEAEFRREHPEPDEAQRNLERGERGVEAFIDRIVGDR